MKILDEKVFLELCYPRQNVKQIPLRDSLKAVGETLGETEVDAYGNLFVTIGDTSTAFTSHLDNVDRCGLDCNTLDMVEGIVSLSKDTYNHCLGADDAAGVYIMLTMMTNKVQGMYCFYLDEEIGCLGSNWSKTNEIERYLGITKMVSFDRMGYQDVITYQSAGRCCSDEFANALCEQINQFIYDKETPFRPCDGGVFTDSNTFVGLITECTNVSVGYFHQHTKSECQDLNFLQEIAEVYCEVDWEGLPTNGFPPEGFNCHYDEPSDYGQVILSELEYLVDVTEGTLREELLEDLEQVYTKYMYPVTEQDPFYFLGSEWRS